VVRNPGYPLPRTIFYERVRKELGEKTNWVDSDDLAVMFRGSYTDEFYRALRDALHTEVSYHLASRSPATSHADKSGCVLPCLSFSTRSARPDFPPWGYRLGNKEKPRS
jgi:hypothetical protein